MEEEIYALHRLLHEDKRYPLEAYVFVREALAYASNVLNLDNETSTPEPEVQLDLESIDNGCGPQMDGFSAHFETYGSIFNSVHGFGSFAVDFGDLTRGSQDPPRMS